MYSSIAPWNGLLKVIPIGKERKKSRLPRCLLEGQEGEKMRDKRTKQEQVI